MTGTLQCSALADQLLVLESMLKTDALASSWQVQKTGWKSKVSACSTPRELEAVVSELDSAIQWSRILVAPDGRALTAAEIASGQFGVGGTPSMPVPQPLSVVAPPAPPEGVPRQASRMLMMLQSMGARKFDPKVVVQLLDVMHTWTAAVLVDASANARMRVLGSTNSPQLALALEPPVETTDVQLAVRTRAEHSFTRVAAREVVAQQAADLNAEPMPILPKRTTVALPADVSQCVPSARRLVEHGLDIDDDEDLEGCGAESGSWWHDRVRRSSVARLPDDEERRSVPKRQRHH